MLVPFDANMWPAPNERTKGNEHLQEQRGLVRREVLASDRRRHALFFQESAEKSYLAASAQVRTFEWEVAARLTRAELRELARLLIKLQGRADAR